jgi:ketosteroid isomerase-like protein
MSEFEQRVRLLRLAYDAFNRRDLGTVLSTLDPDVEWPNMLDLTTLHGHRAVRDYWERQFQEIDPSVEPIAFIPDGGDQLIVEVHQVLRDRCGSVFRDNHVAHRYTFRGQLVVRMRVERAIEDGRREDPCGQGTGPRQHID